MGLQFHFLMNHLVECEHRVSYFNAIRNDMPKSRWNLQRTSRSIRASNALIWDGLKVAGDPDMGCFPLPFFELDGPEDWEELGIGKLRSKNIGWFSQCAFAVLFLRLLVSKQLIFLDFNVTECRISRCSTIYRNREKRLKQKSWKMPWSCTVRTWQLYGWSKSGIVPSGASDYNLIFAFKAQEFLS